MSYWNMTDAERVALAAHREAAGIPAGLSNALESNDGSGRNEEDIRRVLAKFTNCENEWEDGLGDAEYVWLVEFNDGERGLFTGWHDYSGWDYQGALTLLPFDGWEERIRAEWDSDREPDAATVIAALLAQLEAPSMTTPENDPAAPLCTTCKHVHGLEGGPDAECGSTEGQEGLRAALHWCECHEPQPPRAASGVSVAIVRRDVLAIMDADPHLSRHDYRIDILNDFEAALRAEWDVERTRLVEAVLPVLRDVEWAASDSGGFPVCPVCFEPGDSVYRQHMPSCGPSAALDALTEGRALAGEGEPRA